MAAEPAGSYEPSGVSGGPVGEGLAAVAAAVAALASADLDVLSDAALEGLLAGLRTPIGQLSALRSRAAAASQARRLAAAPQAPRGGTIRDHQNRMAGLQNQTPSETKRDVEAGKTAGDHHATGQVFAAGDLSAEHVRMIGRVLADIGDDRQEAVEAELLALAIRMDAVAFGRAARRIQGRETPRSLARDQRRQHRHRRFRATDTPDGGWTFAGTLYGDAAETARVALDAFRRPDTEGEHREPEQRNADAFEQLCTTALRTGQAPTDHGVRPHVLITIDLDQYNTALTGGTGTATLAHSGQPITTDHIGHLLADADLTRIILDAETTPIEVSTTSRHVPHGLWKALVVRDQGCTWPGCTAPTSWCDVAHGHTAYHKGGRLSPNNAALLCRRHHRRFDRGPYTIHIDGNHVTYQRTDTPDLSGPGGPDPSGPDGPDPSGPDNNDPPPAPGQLPLPTTDPPNDGIHHGRDP